MDINKAITTTDMATSFNILGCRELASNFDQQALLSNLFVKLYKLTCKNKDQGFNGSVRVYESANPESNQHSGS